MKKAQVQEVLRKEIQAFTVDLLARIGPETFRKAAVANMFAGLGPSRSTLYRWIDEVVDARPIDQPLAHQVEITAHPPAEPATLDALRLAIAREMLRADPDLAARVVRRLIEAGAP